MVQEWFCVFEERVILVLWPLAAAGSESLEVVGAVRIGRTFAGWLA